MSLLDKKTIKTTAKAILITLVVAFLLNMLIVHIYSISSLQMSDTIEENDVVLVNKMSYGSRLPNTPLSLPFAPEYYSDAIEIPYYRLFSSKVKKNDVVTFNSPLEQNLPIDKRTLLMSRCVAVPNDTVVIKNNTYFINGKELIKPPLGMEEFVLSFDDFSRINEQAQNLDIKVNIAASLLDSVIISLNNVDANILKNATALNFKHRKSAYLEHVSFVIPTKGSVIQLTPSNIKVYKNLIQEENKETYFEKDKKIYVDGNPIDFYTVKEDYYWLLSDNTTDAIDSHTLGFIPFSSIEGKVSLILYNKEKSRLFKSVN